MNLSNLIKGNKKLKLSGNFLKKLREEYEKEISWVSSYLVTEREWCESQDIEYPTLFTSRGESAVEISRNYTIKLFKKVDKYKIFYEED